MTLSREGDQSPLLLTHFHSVTHPLSHRMSSSQSGGVWRGLMTRTHHVTNPHEGEPLLRLLTYLLANATFLCPADASYWSFCVFLCPPVPASAAASCCPEPKRNNCKLLRRGLLAVPGRRQHPVHLGDVVQGLFQGGGVLPNGLECWE